jgi:hypothetical protein
MRAMFIRLCLALTIPSAPITAHALASPAAITYPAGGTQHIHVFARGHDNRLVSNDFDGTTWIWTDHGKAPGGLGIGAPAVVTFNDGGTQFIYAFAVTDNKQLAVRYWNGVSWSWADQGGPALDVWEAPSAISYVDSSGARRIYVFAKTGGSRGRLVVNYWDGASWNWADLGPNFGFGVHGSPQAITYVEDGLRRIQVYCRVRMITGKTNVAVLNWTGTEWIWGNTGVEGITYMMPVTFVDAGVRKTYLFMNKSFSILLRYWDGVSWKIEDLGKPADTYLLDITALTYVEGGQRKIRVFGSWGGRAYSKVWNGSSWTWFDHGNDPNVAELSPVTYVDARSGTRRIQVFATANDGLKRHYWNGSSWNWFDQGPGP